ncbi:MAG: hypothetical protein IKW33_04790 [Clostridia bacterium]|nr:hypothetical protein [Clostridia bacterium]
MDILIFAGQSNMQGSSGEIGVEIAENCLEYKFLTDKFVMVKDPVGENIGDGIFWQSTNGGGSLIPSFCNAYAKKKGSAVAIHCARGNTSIALWKPGTERYKALVEKCKCGIVRSGENFDINKIYFIWLQGESDALKKNTEEGYLNELKELKNALKKDLGINKFCIIKVGYFAEYAEWQPDATKINDEYIMNAQERAVKEDEDFVILTRICAKLSLKKRHLNPKENGPHYNNRALNIIGRKAGKALAKLK